MTTKKFKLIQGIFDNEHAKNLLLELVESKIRYHKKQMLSNQERFGFDKEHSEKRINELEHLQSDLVDLFGQASMRAKAARVESDLIISFIDLDKKQEV
jgi:hypothetical protein